MYQFVRKTTVKFFITYFIREVCISHFGKTFPITSDLGPRKYNGTKGTSLHIVKERLMLKSRASRPKSEIL